MGRIAHIPVHTGEKSYLSHWCGLDLARNLSMRGMPLSCALCEMIHYTTITISDYLPMHNTIIIEYLRKHKLNPIIHCQCECCTERLVNYYLLCENQVGKLLMLAGHMIIHTEDIRLYAKYNYQNYKIEVSNIMVFTDKLDDYTVYMTSVSGLILWHALLTWKCRWKPFSCTKCDISPNQITEFTNFQWIYIQMYYCTMWDKWLHDILDYLKCRYKI